MDNLNIPEFEYSEVNNTFNPYAYYLYYLKYDVLVLKAGLQVLRSKMIDLTNLNIHNIIGLSNNKKIDENKWFADNILKYINDKTIENEIISKITIDNLLKSVDVMYDTFIKLNWKGKALISAHNKIGKLEKEYEELGKEDLEITDVYNHIKSNLNLTELISYPFNCFYYKYRIK